MDNYKSILNSVSLVLKEAGYIKKDSTFYLFKDNNWGILNFQKSRDSSKYEAIFTLNIGIVSTALRRNIDRDTSNNKPSTGRYHWESRIGRLMPEQKDFWWKYNDSDDLDNIIIDVVTAVKKLAMPAINAHISDNDLISAFISDSPGTSLINKYIYLTTLLKLNNDNRLGDFIHEMLETTRRKPFEDTANEHVRFVNTL